MASDAASLVEAVTNPRLWLAIWIALFLLVAWLNAQDQYRLAVGRVNPTDQEAQECYFPLSNAASVNLHPDGEPCKWMRTQVGKTGMLFFIPDD